MKAFGEPSHYDVLEISREADAELVARAYHLIRDVFAEGSMATYGVYNMREVEVIRRSTEEAFRVLSDPDTRAAYDLELQNWEAEAEPGRPETSSSGWAVAPTAGETIGSFAEESAFEFGIGEEDGPLGGRHLQRLRLARGMEIDEVAEVTKVNPLYLRAIEAECFEDLPAEVYVRGFLGAYAGLVGLPAEELVSSFLERFREARGTVEQARRHWLRGRGH